MNETIKILRERAILCTHLPELLDELIKIMRTNSPDVQAVISKIEKIQRNLSRNEQKTQEFLKQINAPSLAEYLSAQEQNLQREVAENLLRKANESLLRLKEQVAELEILLRRGQNYAEFNLNILGRISASPTYGAGAQTESQRSRRMFEANI